jgi:hypothetical protein
MSKDFKILLTIVVTLLLMFATSLLLDLQLVQRQTVRQLLVYLTISIEAVIGYMFVKLFLKL